MTKKKHIKRHKKLHKILVELSADYSLQTDRSLHDSTILELLRWSDGQKKQLDTQEYASGMSPHDEPR